MVRKGSPVRVRQRASGHAGARTGDVARLPGSLRFESGRGLPAMPEREPATSLAFQARSGSSPAEGFRPCRRREPATSLAFQARSGSSPAEGSSVPAEPVSAATRADTNCVVADLETEPHDGDAGSTGYVTLEA